MSVKAFRLDQRLAVQAESALSPCFAAWSCIDCCAPAGAGKMNSFPSVRTPSTSNSRSLILLARALDMAGILASTFGAGALARLAEQS